LEKAENNPHSSALRVPEHEGIAGNETADQLAKTGSEYPFIGPEPACGISMGVTKKAIRDWATMNDNKYRESLTGLKQAKGLIRGSSTKRAKELLKLNRNQLKWVVGLLIGHCHLKGHLFKLGLSDGPTCERCQEKDEMAMHVLCECEALAH
jgi:hypothetical protein